METNSLKLFSFNFKEIIIDEIGLNGLEGIGLNLLWKRVEVRVSASVTLKMKTRFWNFIVNNNSFTFYNLEKPLPDLNLLDRFTMIDDESGFLLDPPDYVDGPYEFCLVENEYGSCVNYYSRTLIKSKNLQSMTYEEVVDKYGSTLVIIASLEKRWKALAPHLPLTYLTKLTPVHYCILEVIGRGRENGQMTVGKTNLVKIANESKQLFYYRQHLQRLDLIKSQYTTQVIGGKAMKSILLRLRKFYKSVLESLPKTGRVHNMVQYLLEKPDFSEQNDVMIKRNFITPQLIKRFQKTSNIFHFEDREMKPSENPKHNIERKTTLKKRFMKMSAPSDSESDSNDENTTPVNCEFKVGVDLLRQTYERFLEAGLQGLTQIQISQLMGVEFYVVRTICRILKSKNLVREFFEDRGRQRVSRYVAIATKEMDKNYADEKNKLLEYIQDSKSNCENKEKRDNTNDMDSISKIPKKKAKLEEENNTEIDDIDCNITELMQIDGLENIHQESLINAKKAPTLRQLRFANGILKIIKEKKYVIGFQALNTLVSNEIGELPMDTKALKMFIQRLIVDGQLKMLKIKWPNFSKKFSYLVCKSDLKPTDPIIRAKYKEILAKSQVKENNKRTRHKISRSLSQYIYPRYTKIQKLHELIMKVVYFGDVKDETFPPGFATLFSIIPEMSIEFALGNISNVDESDIPNLQLTQDIFTTKLKNAPHHVNKVIIQCKSFQNSVRVALNILAVLGLIQIIDKPSKIFGHHVSLLSCVFYANRSAKILDTSGKWPREENLKTLEKSFEFLTYEDVKFYWNEVMTISANTTITVTRPDTYKLIYPPRNEQNVKEYDTGERFGDGLGPCGFDCCIHMDMPRLWKSHAMRSVYKRAKTSKIIKPGKTKVKTKAKLKTVTDKKPVTANHRVKDNAMKIPKPRIRIRKPMESHVKWTALDDRIIMMCKVAITILSPVALPGCLRIRNTVARDLLTLYDSEKSASMCHRRAQYLDTKSETIHEKNCILNELRRRRDLIKDYEGLLKVLKSRSCSNIYKIFNEAKIPMLEIITLITQIIKTKSFTQQVPCIALNIEDFNKHYTIAITSSNRHVSGYKTSSSDEFEFGAVKEGIIQSVMLSYENKINKKTAKKIFSIFKNYPEKNLRSAIDQLRKGGAIVAREKSLNNQFNKGDVEDLIQSSYKVSAIYRRKCINTVITEFLDELANVLDQEILQSGLKGRSDLNCLFCEMTCCDVLEVVSDTVPVVTGAAGSTIQEDQINIIDMETKLALKSGMIGWKNKRNIRKFSELYQKSGYEDIFDILTKKSFITFGTNVDTNRSDGIVTFVENAGFKGCTFKELQDNLGIDYKTLQNKLTELEAMDTIKRIGYFENKIMLTKFTKSRMIQINQDTYMIPAPWLDFEGNMRTEIFFNWTTVIMHKIFDSPGYSIGNLCDALDCISARNIQDVCLFLEKCECVTLKTIVQSEPDLFSDDDVVPDLADFNPYDAPENNFVFPVKNCLTKYAYVKKQIVLQDKT